MSENSDPQTPLQKAFAIISLLAQTGYPMNAPDIGAELGLNRQTVHRLLSQLEAIKIIRRDIGRERFEIGPALVQLGLQAQNGNQTSRLRRAVMEKLVAASGEDCNLCVLDGHEIVYIDHVPSHSPLRRHVEIGGRMPAYCTATGKVLLAHLPDKVLDQYLSVASLAPWTEQTWTEAEQLRKHLADIRQQGYAINNQENLIGLMAIATPVRDPLGRVVAALSIDGPEARLSESRACAFAPELSDAAKAICELIAEGASKRVTA